MGLFSSDTKTNPFKDAEERMHEKMMSAEGDSVDETFVLKMIAHHQGGIDAGEILLSEGIGPRAQNHGAEEQRAPEEGDRGAAAVAEPERLAFVKLS